jgi:NAD(P)-dependent dehydrogenase (short-subunit alcohol dehydrogenase family)
MLLTRILILTILSVFLFATTAIASESETNNSEQQAILVTGASTGIGRAIAEKLAAEGFFVYAGARKQVDLDDLDAIENVRAVRLDVTVDDEIKAAVELVRTEGRGLYGLVNNAGVLITGPTSDADIDSVKWLFDVNVYGVMRVTQAFAPLIIESRGRIINMGSIAGTLAHEFLGPYAMTKHAMEAYSDSLGDGMKRFGVNVSVVEPGDYTSEIWNKDIAKAKMSAGVAEDSPYYEDYQNFIDFVVNLEAKSPTEVADTTLRALTDEAPSRRYLIVPNEMEMGLVMGAAVTRLAEINAKHDYSYSEEKLLAMLQEAMAQQR